ncbi:MAG: DUF3806 domain-containing protein [Burkholderiales bacterium]|nr:DUF3806 domain-containing protein [Burkholderiales bacterium]
MTISFDDLRLLFQRQSLFFMRKFFVATVLFLTSMVAAAQASPKPPLFTPLSAESKAELDDFRRLVTGLVRIQNPKWILSRTPKDFEILQIFAEGSSMKKADRNTWIAVGVAFGDALIAFIPGLSWSDMQDEYGPGVVLRYKQTTMTIAAPTMLAKRVERGESFDLRFMAIELKKYVTENAGKVQ